MKTKSLIYMSTETPVKPLFTSALMRLNGCFWSTRQSWVDQGMQMCEEVMSKLWNLDPSLPIRLVLTRTRAVNSYRIHNVAVDETGLRDRIRIEGRRKGELMLLSDELNQLLFTLLDQGDVFVAVDIIEEV